jgi:PAS domain S-box-containing protein
VRRRRKQISRHLAVLQQLATLDSSDKGRTFQTICTLAARSLDVEQVGIWLFSADRRRLRAETVYHFAEDRHDSGFEISADEYPRFFRALDERGTIATRVTADDPRTSELADSYLVPQGITSSLDVPIYEGGHSTGVLCVEHKGPARTWTLQEQEFAHTLADAVALAIEAGQRRRAEAALRESEERYTLAVAGARDGLWDWDLGKDRLFYSARWKSMLGHGELEIGDQPQEWFSRVHEGALARLRDGIRAHLDGQTPDFELEYRMRHKDGSWRWMLSRGLAVRDAGGRATRMAGSQTDITDRKRAEEERERLYREALGADRRKDEFLAVVSHELRTPLTSILGWAGMLKTGKLNAPTTLRALDSIERNAKAQSRLIDDLLDISRIITGKVRLDARPVNVGGLLEGAVDSVRVAANAKSIELVATLDARVVSVPGDPDRLQQVLWNLVSNAIKFTPAGGRVEVRLELAAGEALISVSDSGCGIPLEFLPYVFDRFRQAESPTTRSHGGLGLGLSIVRHLVELHGGTVSAHSEGAGQGSRFAVRLPLAPPPLPAGARPPARAGDVALAHPALALGGLNVLLVEDEPDTRELLATALEYHGAEVVAADSAAAAIRSLKSVWPHVLISDIAMPEEDGLNLIRKIRSLEALFGKQALPAIALTAHAGATDKKTILSAGFREHIAKPVEPLVLAIAVARLVGRAWTPVES